MCYLQNKLGGYVKAMSIKDTLMLCVVDNNEQPDSVVEIVEHETNQQQKALKVFYNTKSYFVKVSGSTLELEEQQPESNQDSSDYWFETTNIDSSDYFGLKTITGEKYLVIAETEYSEIMLDESIDKCLQLTDKETVTAA